MHNLIKCILPHLWATTQFLSILFLCIIIHELGHLFAAQRCHCKVNVFSVGFGKILWQRYWNGTIYQICWIFLGGFCSLEGELEYSKSKTALTNLKYRQKLYIVMAGIAANCLSAIIVFGLFTMFQIEFFYLFGLIAILLGLSNLLIVFPGIDGCYPFLFLLEKPFGKKEGIKVMQRAVEVGMFFINLLNVACVYYIGYQIVMFITRVIK
jgi:membrane-associated protease RseP (regulator of RpoE activity)